MKEESAKIIIKIIIIILIHYHKRLTCRRIESAYRFIGLAFFLAFSVPTFCVPHVYSTVQSHREE